MIPKVAHRIWLDEPIPDELERYWESFYALHPDWQMMTWNRSSMLAWMQNKPIFDQCQTWAGKSDVARYEILATFGGVYLDTDVEPLKPFDDLLDGDPFAGWEDGNMICPTVMGGEAGHPALVALVDGLPAWFKPRKNRPPNQATGPHFLTRMWRNRTDVRLFDPVTFYPVHWSSKKDLGGPYPPESFAVHHWNAGWLPGGPPQRTA